MGRYDGFDDEYDDLYDYEYDDDLLPDGTRFARPGSALRAETEDNPRDCACPTCGAPDVLTRADIALGYQCDRCADDDEVL